MNSQSDFLSELTGDTLGGVQTDHGGITFADVIVLLLDLVLLIYTGWRSYDFLTTTVPSGMEILALVGLWGLDIGAVAWSLVWIFGSTGKFQNWVSISMFLIDLVGVGLTGLTDLLMYGNEGVMVDALSSMTRVAVPVVLFINVVAGFIFHMTSPQTRERRKLREMQAEHAEKMREVRQAQMRLAFTQAQLLARQETVELADVMAQIKVLQDQIEQNARKRLRDNRMAGVQGQLTAMTGIEGSPLMYSPTLQRTDTGQMTALRQGLEELEKHPSLSSALQTNASRKPGKNILSGLTSLVNRVTGKKDDPVPGTDELVAQIFQDAEDGLISWEEAAQTLHRAGLSEEAQIAESMIPPQPTSAPKTEPASEPVDASGNNHPQAGNNGGHQVNP